MLTQTFSADTWRRVAYATVSAPVGLAVLVLSLVGGHRRAAGWQRRVTRRLLDAPSTPDSVDGPLRTVGYALLSVPFGLVGLSLVLMVGPNTVRNLLYGVFTDGSYVTSWGGPTLAGAWAVHAALAVLLLPVWLWLVRGVTGVQRVQADALLGDRRLPAGTAVGSGLLLLAAGALLVVWIRQI